MAQDDRSERVRRRLVFVTSVSQTTAIREVRRFFADDDSRAAICDVLREELERDATTHETREVWRAVASTINGLLAEVSFDGT